jgi:TatD DNase family protein
LQLIDTHAHLTSPALVSDLDALIERAKAAYLQHIVNICTDPVSLREGLLLEEKVPWIRNAGATTPHDVEKDGEECFPIFEQAARDGKLIAVGETGLDYFYEHSNREVQQKFLVRYLQLALELKLPVIFHCREAFADLFAIADREIGTNIPAILHCFTGTLEEAKAVVARGWMISFSGILTFKKSEELRQTARQMPLENLFIETDAPYLAPQSKRGQTNESSFIAETATCLASLKGISLEEMARISTENASRIFSF